MRKLLLALSLLLATSAHAASTRTLDAQQITNGAAIITLPTATVDMSGLTSLTGSNSGDVSLGTANGLSLTGQSLSLGLASTSTTGALSGSDWNIFNGKQAAGNYLTALTGDGTASGPGSAALTLATVNSNTGTFTNATVTVNGKGLITAVSSGSGATPTATGTAGSPSSVTAVGGVVLTTPTPTNVAYIQGNGGAVTVTANPRISGCASGQANYMLTLVAESGTNTVTLQDGNGLSLNGTWIGAANSVIEFLCDGTNWVERARR